jgi:putative transposase
MDLALAPTLYRPTPSSTPNPLRDRFAPHVERSVLSMLDPDRIDALAEDMRVVQRHRVHHSGLLVCALVLSAFRQTEVEGRWLDTAALYRELGGPETGMTSIRNMGRKMLPVMHSMLRRRMKQLAAEAKNVELQGRLRAFHDVLIPDGCAFKLASVLSGISPGTGQPAELKLHTVYSVKARTALEAVPTAGSVHDSDGFWPTWQSGALYIWDLGFQSVERFVAGALAGAHLLQRLKDKHNPEVVASYGPTGARRVIRDSDGAPVRLEEALAVGLVHKSEQLDLDVKLVDRSRKLANGKHPTVIARLVCVPTEGEDRYYLTTLPRSTFTPCDIAELYRIRWEAELFFRNWKGGVRMDHVHRLRNPSSLAVAVTASMLAALLSRDLQNALDDVSEALARSASDPLDRQPPSPSDDGVPPCGIAAA